MLKTVLLALVILFVIVSLEVLSTRLKSSEVLLKSVKLLIVEFAIIFMIAAFSSIVYLFSMRQYWTPIYIATPIIKKTTEIYYR